MAKKPPMLTTALGQVNDSQSKLIAIHVSRESQRIYVRTRKFPFVLAAILFTIPWILLAALYFGFLSKPNDAVAAEQIKAGPWGVMTSFEFITDPPSEFLTDDLFPAHPAEWHFGTISKDALTAIFSASRMSAEQSARILATAQMDANLNWVVHPSDDDVLNLPVESRRVIYAELAKIPVNQRQVDPFIFDPKKLDTWLTESQLSPAIVGNTKKLLYPQGNTALLADTVTLMKTIPSRDDRQKLLNVLMRRVTVMLKLNRSEQIDVRALTAYWGVGGREEVVRPMIDSLYHNREGMIVDVALLLPRFARDRLYMYPLPSNNPKANHRDCHWTAFNFFNLLPDDRFTEPSNVKAELEANYAQIDSALQLGDVAIFQTADDKVVHSCVYVADDLYFSKNGPSRVSPWVLMHIGDVKKHFPVYDDLTIKHYRMKKTAGGQK